jgi:hypothetical protein
VLYCVLAVKLGLLVVYNVVDNICLEVVDTMDTELVKKYAVAVVVEAGWDLMQEIGYEVP